MPKSLRTGVLAPTHSGYGHPGVARSTALVSCRYHWPTLTRDVREYVLSCGCMKRQAHSQRVSTLPARFLLLWEMIEIDFQAMGETSEAGSKYLLVVEDKASTFLFAYLLPTKEAVGVARKVLELFLTFRMPLSIRSDPGRSLRRR